MGNEMGNNNTSGLREEVDRFQDKSLLEVAHADDLKGSQIHVASADIGKENSNGDGQDDVKAEGKKSLLEVAQLDEVKGQNQEVSSSSDVNKIEKETSLASINLEGVAGEPHDYKDEKEEAKNMIPEVKERSSHEVAYVDEGERQDNLVSAAEDKNTHGSETKLASSEHEGTASIYVDNQKQDQKGEDNSTNIEAEEISLQEPVNTVETKAQSDLDPAAADPDGMPPSSAGDQKHDEKGTASEEDNTLNDEAKGKSSQEAVNTNLVERQDHLLPGVEDKSTHKNETVPVSFDPEVTADRKVDNPEQDEKEEDNKDFEHQGKPLPEDAHGDDIEDKNLKIEGAEGEDCNNNPKQDHKEEGNMDTETQQEKALIKDAHADDIEKKNITIAADDIEEKNLTIAAAEGEDFNNNMKQNGKEEDNTEAEPQQEKPLAKDAHADDIEEKMLTISAAEAEAEAEAEDCNNKETEAELASGDLIVVDQSDQLLEGQGKFELYPATESTKVESKPSEAADEGRVIKPASSSENLENLELQQESILEENPSGTSFHFEEQNSIMKAKDEGTRKSNTDAASDTSHDSVPQEHAVVEPEQSEIAKFSGEELLQVCNEQQKSDHMIKPYLACASQENGFVSDSSLSTEMVKGVFPDLSPEVENEMNDFSVKEITSKEVSSEEQFKLKDEDEAGNNSENATIPLNGASARCNGEFPSEVNSVKTDSSELHVDGILSDKAHDFKVEVSETEDKGIVLEAILARKVSENGDSNHSHCQIQSVEESVEKSDGKGSEEESKADEQNASLSQFLLNGHQQEEERCLLNASSNSNSIKDCQIEETKIMKNVHLTDACINPHNEATEEQQKDSEKEALLVTDPAVNSADYLLSVQKLKEEESEEKKIIEEMEEKVEDLNPLGSVTTRRQSQEQCIISHSYPTEQAEAFPSALHPLPENDQRQTQAESKKLYNSDESMAELKHQSSGEISPTASSSFVTKNLEENSLISMVELGGEKPLLDLSESLNTAPVTMADTKPSVKQPSEQCAIGETPTMANRNYCQQESMGRFSTESNPDNMSIMRKSPSFDLDLRIDAREEESDQTPLLCQDKTTIESFSNQADVTLGKVTVPKTENITNSLQHQPMAAEEKVVTLERSDSEKSKTPFLGFLKEEEEETHMLVTPKKQDNPPAAMKATAKVSVKEITSASQKGKEKRKPRTSLFGTCMCCAAVIN